MVSSHQLDWLQEPVVGGNILCAPNQSGRNALLGFQGFPALVLHDPDLRSFDNMLDPTGINNEECLSTRVSHVFLIAANSSFPRYRTSSVGR